MKYMNESTIYKKLNDYFSPSFLKVVNESEKHKNHAGSPGTGNSHFYIEIKSEELTKISRLEGQRKIFKILEKEMKESIHALSIKIIY